MLSQAMFINIIWERCMMIVLFGSGKNVSTFQNIASRSRKEIEIIKNIN